MAVKRDHARAVTDPADEVTHRVDRDLVVVELLHLLADTLDHRAFLRTQRGNADDVLHEGGELRFDGARAVQVVVSH